MMVSTRGRYALRVMIDLAEHNNGKFIPLKDIAGAAGNFRKISGKHREILNEGRRAGGSARQRRRLPADQTGGGIQCI